MEKDELNWTSSSGDLDTSLSKIYNDCTYSIVNIEHKSKENYTPPLFIRSSKSDYPETPETPDHAPLIRDINTISVKLSKEPQFPVKTDNGLTAPVQKGWRRYIGLVLAFASSFSFSIAILIVKYLPNYHAFSFGVWRFIGIFLPSIPILIVEKYRHHHNIFDNIFPWTDPTKRKTFILLIFRCVCGSCAIVLQYYSLNYMEIADSTVIVFSTPCFVTLFAWFILGESCGVIPIIAAILSLLGVTIVCRPPILQGQHFDEQLLIGIGLAFSSMICATIVFIVLRSLRKVYVGLITSMFGFIGIIQCSVLCLIIQRFDIPDNAWEWFLIISVALTSFLGQTFITCALKYEQAGAISLVRSCDVIFAFIWQYIFLNVHSDIYSFVGSVVVLTSVFLIGLRKLVSTFSIHDPWKKRLWFLLK